MWAADYQLKIFLIGATHFALYLLDSRETKASKSVVKEAVSGLAWAHSMAGIISSTTSQVTLKGLKRTLAKLVCKKSPLDASTVRDAKKTNTLTSLRLVEIATYVSKLLQDFSVFDELVRPTFSHVI